MIRRFLLQSKQAGRMTDRLVWLRVFCSIGPVPCKTLKFHPDWRESLPRDFDLMPTCFAVVKYCYRIHQPLLTPDLLPSLHSRILFRLLQLISSRVILITWFWTDVSPCPNDVIKQEALRTAGLVGKYSPRDIILLKKHLLPPCWYWKLSGNAGAADKAWCRS